MRLVYIAGFLVYLMLSLIVIMPMEVSAFNATVTGSADAKNARSELDITKISVLAESQVSIQATDGQNYDMDCTNVGSYKCSYTFQENTLSPGAHTLIFHQENGTPSTMNHVFFVDNVAPNIISFSAEVIELPKNLSQLIGNKLNISLHANDPQLTNDENSCAGIKTISLTTETQTLLEKTVSPECDFELDELVNVENVEGNITLILSVTDAVGNLVTEQVAQLNVDFKAPSISDDFTLWLGDQEVTTIADQPQLFPYVDVQFSISEKDLSEVIVDASSLTANPAVYPSYTELEPDCELQGSQNICTLSNLELNPSSGNIMLSVRATDNNSNVAIKNITKTLEVVDVKGEITYFNPLEKHCDADICYMKKGSNIFKLNILHEQSVVPSLITLMTGEINPLPKMKVSTCNETISGTYECLAYLPVTIDQSGVSKKILLTTPSTDVNGNALKGITQTTVMVDTVKPNATSQAVISDLCPTAGMTATINLTAKEETSSKLFLTAETNTTTGGYNFTNECVKENSGDFYCEVLLQQFVSYPEKENITLVLEDLAGNKQTQEFNLRVCQAESDVAPESIRSIATATNQRINKRVASATTTKVFLPLTFQVQGSIAPNMEILAIESDGCLNTEYLGAKPYFINEDTFVRTQEFNANRGEVLFVVPIGKQNIMDDDVTIDCNLSIYQRIGETRYLIPEKQQVKITLDAYNNPLGTISNTTASQLTEIKDDIAGLQKDIDSRMKLHQTLEFICNIADLIGKVTQAVSIVESAVYVVALALYPISQSASGKVWGLVCKVVEKFESVKKVLFKNNASESLGSISTQVLKLACVLYRCGLCTVDGLMSTVNMGLSVGKALQSDKAKLAKTNKQIKQESDNIKKEGDALVQKTYDDFNKQSAEGYPTYDEYMANEGDKYQSRAINIQNRQAANVQANSQTNEEKSKNYNTYLADSFADSVKKSQETNSPWILDPYKSKTYAGICLCNSGMIYALNKERQLKCKEYTCIQSAAAQGLPISECQKDYKVASCLYVEGAMSKRTLMGQIWEGIKNSLLSDPVKTVRMAVCLDDYLPVNTGLTKQTACKSIIVDWRTVFCTLTDAYLHLRDIESLWSNPFEKSPLTPDGTDFCAGMSTT